MRPAQIIVFVTALTAGGGAMFLMRSEPPPAPQLAAVPSQKVDTVDVLVAKGEIGVGHQLTAQDVQWQPWPLSVANSQYIKRTSSPEALGQIAGAITRSPFAAGEPLREAKLIRANGSGYMAAIVSPGMRAIATDISPESGVGGFVLPNDRVDVILTRAERNGAQEVFSSETILSDVRVLAIDQTVEDKDGKKVVVGKIATVELPPRKVETLALARRLGTLSLSLRGLRDQSRDRPDADERLGTTEKVSIVRFGVPTAVVSK